MLRRSIRFLGPIQHKEELHEELDGKAGADDGRKIELQTMSLLAMTADQEAGMGVRCSNRVKRLVISVRLSRNQRSVGIAGVDGITVGFKV